MERVFTLIMAQGDEDSADDHRHPSQRLHEGVGSPSGARDVHLYVGGAHELVGEADEGHAEHDAEDEARDLAMLVGVGEGVLVGQLDDADLRRLADTADGSPQGNSRADGNRAVKAKAGGGESTSEKLNRSGEAICPMATAAVASRSDTRRAPCRST